MQSTDIQSSPLPRRSPWSILFRFVIAATLLFLGVSWLAENDINSRIGDPRLERGIGTTQAVIRVAGADLGESPGLTPDPSVGPLPLCEPVSDYDERALREGIGLMRGTERGQGLYSLIVNEGVCIRVADLPYNSAYATARWSPLAGWSESEIVIDFDEVSLLYPDVLAAILVHEAVHIERAVNRTACFYADTCTTLDNGVRLEEEIVAHAAEAEWWLEAYGNSGKNFAFRSDHAQNRLANAYLRGNSEFREYVLQGRSNPREGEGIR